MQLLRALLTRFARLFYHVPFDHNIHEIYWHCKYRVKNLVKHNTLDMFYKIELETISTCNRRCRYCPNYLYPKEHRTMPCSYISKIVSDLQEIHYSSMVCPHFYGEPLLDQRLPAIIREIKANLPKATVVIYTNGDFLDRGAFDRLVAAGTDKFFVTAHEGQPPERFLAWYRSCSGKDGRKVIFEEMTEESTLSNRGGSVEVKHKKIIKKCSMPRNNPVIDAEGNVLLCVNDFFGRHKMGNITMQPILAIWRTQEYKKLRRDINRGDFTIPLCQRCAS